MKIGNNKLDIIRSEHHKTHRAHRQLESDAINRFSIIDWLSIIRFHLVPSCSE